MSNETRSPASEKPEPQKINPKTGELNDEQLDDTSGGNGFIPSPPRPGPPPPAP